MIEACIRTLMQGRLFEKDIFTEKFLTSADGHDTLRHNWGLFALIVVLFLFNTVLGEELLFRGLLLPRMRGAFGSLYFTRWHPPRIRS